MAKVVTNLQIFIDKIHVRYEDDTTHPGVPLFPPLLIMIVLSQNPFVYGMTLESLYAQSTDFGWNPTFLTETNQPLVHKVSACQRDTFVE